MLAFRREPGFVCAANLGATAEAVPPAVARMRQVLATTDLTDVLPPASAAWWVEP